ncbi:MAG: hypothetical protein GY849_05375 [Deltaproteobacteria bacterium]|nr:hypothetical protein [Deltaproteobacteria bacterium]
MKWFELAIVFILGFVVASPLAADQSRLARIIPVEMENQGWKAEEEPFIAGDENALSMIVNGAAPRYMALGTQQALFINYKKENAYLMLEIYETDSNSSAEKIFNEFVSDRAESLEDMGTRARATSEMGGTYMVEYFQGGFYVRLSVTEKSAEAKKSVLVCAMTISDRIAKISKN